MRNVADPLLPEQWNLEQIRAPQAWEHSTGAGVRIGIVDTGVQTHHEDLVGKVVASANCVGANGNPNACSGIGEDDNGHGTHVAGIAAAARNGRGMVGVAPDALLVVAKVLNNNEGGTIVDVEAGIRWVVRHGAQVVNLSVGDNPNAPKTSAALSFQKAVDEAWNAGAIPVVAAGNPNALGPARENFNSVHALVVGATSANGRVAGYSNPLWTAAWGLVAPGGSGTNDHRDIVSSFWVRSNPPATSTYAWRSGASMAAAHVSGVAALLLNEGFTRDEVVRRILSTATPIACGGGCRGRLDAAAAVSPLTPPSFAFWSVPALRAAAPVSQPASTTPPPTAAPAPPPVDAPEPSVRTKASEPAPIHSGDPPSQAVAIDRVTSTRPWGDVRMWLAVVVLLGLGATTTVVDGRARRRTADQDATRSRVL